MNTGSEKLYESYSSYGLIRIILYKIICLLIILYLCKHYDENPVLISILIAFVLGIGISVSRGKIILFSDRFIIMYDRLIPILSSVSEYRFDEISSIHASLPLTESRHMIIALLPTHLSFATMWNMLTITYKDNKKKDRNSRIYRQEFVKSLEQIKIITGNRIEVTIADK